MTKEEIISHLKSMGPATIANRKRVAKLFIDQPDDLESLIAIIYDVGNKISIKAAWTLEVVCLHDITLISPYLEQFTHEIDTITFGSAVRPVAKICGVLSEEYKSRISNVIQEKLTSDQIERLIEAGFDWLISDHKVAVKVYTMEFLYNFGSNFDWVHEELKMIIEKNIGYESCGYLARGRKILARINQNK